MNVRILLLPATVILLSTGCRKDPYMQVYIDNMNAEKRLLEDTLYDLQYDYDTKAGEVERLRKELEDLKSGSSSVLTPGASSSGRSGDEPRDLFPDIPDLNIDQGTPSKPPPSGSDKETIDLGPEFDDVEPPKLDLGDGSPLSTIPMPLDQQVTNLHVDSAITGGLQRDDQPGDDGIVVVFQPRNEDSDFVPAAGRVSVVLLDPETRQRVARWEISKEQIEVALQQAHAGRGVELTLPWQDTPPTQSRLHLFVRYWLPDGKAVQADREITITPNGQLAARWTPRTEQRPDPPKSRLNVADSQDPAPAGSTDTPGNATQQDGWQGQGTSNAPPAASRQARLPQWRPYR